MSTTAVSITQAKNNLADAVNRAAYGRERFLLLSRGKPKAAVVSVEDLRLLESLREDREARKAEQAAWLAQADALRQRIAERVGRPLPSPPGLHRHAWELAARLNRPAAYDAHYLAFAEMMACEFWAADKRLANAVQDELSWVRWLEDYDLAAEQG